MKRFIMALAILTGTLASLNAQTEQGAFLLAGNTQIGFTSETSEPDQGGIETTTNTFSFEPTAGYFVIDNLAIGAGLGLTFQNRETGNQETSFTRFDFGPLARYYFGEDNIKFYPQIGFKLLFGSQESGGQETDFNGFFFNIGGGAAFFVTDNIAIEGLLAFDLGSQEQESGNGFGGQNLEFDIREFTFGFGVSIFFE